MLKLRHRTRAVIAVLPVLLLVASGHAAPGDVLLTHDAPCNYPAGLAAVGDHLYLLDWREAKLFRVEMQSGAVQRSWDAPTLRPRGLAHADGRLFISDDRSRQICVFNPDTGVVENTFAAPGGRPSGLAYNAGVLYVLERASRKVYRVLPEDGTILGYFALPERDCADLAHDGRYLWTSNRVKDELYMVHPETGQVIGILAAPGPHATGLAWDGTALWNADFQTRKLYRLQIKSEPMYRVFDSRTARCEYYWTLYNYGPGRAFDVTLNLAVPEPLVNQQLLTEPRFSPAPDEIRTDRWGQRCALFRLPGAEPGRKLEVRCEAEVALAALRYLIIPEETGTLADIPAEIREAYLADDSRYRIDSPFIQETVRKVVGDEQNPYWIARKIYDYVIDKLTYEMVGGWDVPEVVLRRGSGSCSEYTFAFIALCRAAGLPARYQGSIVIRNDDASVDEAFHRWAQIYLPNYGWVPVDANKGDAESPADQARGFGELDNRYLITTHGGGGSEYLHWGYNSYVHYRADGYCKVERETYGFWEPHDTPPEQVQSGADQAGP